MKLTSTLLTALVMSITLPGMHAGSAHAEVYQYVTVPEKDSGHDRYRLPPPDGWESLFEQEQRILRQQAMQAEREKEAASERASAQEKQAADRQQAPGRAVSYPRDTGSSGQAPEQRAVQGDCGPDAAASTTDSKRRKQHKKKQGSGPDFPLSGRNMPWGGGDRRRGRGGWMDPGDFTDAWSDIFDRDRDRGRRRRY